MKEIVERLHENRQIELAKSILESNGYKVSKKMNEAEDYGVSKKLSISQLLKGYDYDLNYQYSHDDGKGMILKNPSSEIPELVDFLVSDKGCEDLGDSYLRAPDGTLLKVISDANVINIVKHNKFSRDAIEFSNRHSNYNLSKSVLHNYDSYRAELDFIESSFDIDYMGSMNRSGERSSSIHLKNPKDEVIEKIQAAGYVKSENPHSCKYSNDKGSITILGGDSQGTTIKVG